ncbi:uncharacterized protein VP01_346g10 [Puccinia sorghi]|uniref:Uncharacterized protein n=1 Tax=Puccinia sorghi TaxID=27349 RepID=A0A0L6UVZ8_9BASI|nr:uncharacterized protein VP01_346g10 [Puccinia sorghi]
MKLQIYTFTSGPAPLKRINLPSSEAGSWAIDRLKGSPLFGEITRPVLYRKSLTTPGVRVRPKLMATEANDLCWFHILTYILLFHSCCTNTASYNSLLQETKMIECLARLFIVWVVIIIFVASANEEFLYGWQQLASNEAASATTTTRLAAFPPIERESHIAHNAVNTGKKPIIQTDNLLEIGPGTKAAYPSSSSFGESSSSGFISVLTKKPAIHFANNYEHHIPSPTHPPESLSEPFNLGRKTQFQSDAPTTPRPLGNSVTHEQDGGRGTKRKMWNSWGDSLSLKTGVTLDENDAQDRYTTTRTSDKNDAQDGYTTRDFLSSFPLEQPNRLSAKEIHIATPQFIPQEIQQVNQNFQLGSNTPSYQNAGASTAPVLSESDRIPWQISSKAGQYSGIVLTTWTPPEQRKKTQTWGADQGITSSSSLRTKHRLRAEKNTAVDWPRSTQTSLNQFPSQHNVFQSENQGSSSKDPEHIPQVSKMLKPLQPETIMPIPHHPLQIDIQNYGRLKFNVELFKGEGPYELDRQTIVELLDPLPKPLQGNFLLTQYQLLLACGFLRRKLSKFTKKSSMPKIEIFMGNVKRWYHYWNKHAKIDLETFHHEEELTSLKFVFPLYLLFVDMIISIIPSKQDHPLEFELDYPQEMRNAIHSYQQFRKIINTPPENGESIIWEKKRLTFIQAKVNSNQRPLYILWKYLEFWMEYNYKYVWNHVIETNGLRASTCFKSFFNTIFTYGIETLNEKLRDYLPNE